MVLGTLHAFLLPVTDTDKAFAEKNHSPRGYRMILFCTGKDPAKEKWEGAKTRFDDVVSIFGADEGRPIESFAQDLKNLVSSASQVYVDLPQTSKRQPYGMKSFLKFLASSSSAKGDLESVMDGLSSTKRTSLAPIVGKMRAIKSKHEQAVLRAAADLSSKGHTKVRLRSLQLALFINSTHRLLLT